MANPNHDDRGRFASGSEAAAGTGNHQAVSPSTATRNVPGHGNVARSKPVVRHAGVQSLGTDTPSRLSAAAQERVTLNKRADASLYHQTGIPATRDLIGTRTTPGKLDPRTSTLVKGGPKPRIRVKATPDYGL
jgi:hypothetical protein